MTARGWRDPNQYLAALGQASISLGNFVLTALVARALGPAEFGVFVVLASIVLFVKNLYWSAVTAPLLVSGATAEDLASPERRGILALFHATASALGAVLVLAGSALALASLGTQPSAALSGLTALSAVAVMSQDCVRRLLQARGHHRRALSIDAVAGALQIALVTGLARGGLLNLDTAFLAVAAPALCAAALACREFRGPWAIRRETVVAAATAHWGYGKWLIATMFLLWTTDRIQVFVGASLIDASAAAGLGVSLTIFGTVGMLFSGVENFVTPLGARMAGAGQWGDFRRLIGHVYTLAVVASAVYVLPIIWLAPIVLRLVMGPDYVMFEDVLRWVGAWALIGSLARPALMGLKAVRRSRDVFVAYAWSAAGAAATVIPMTESSGASGAAMNMAVGAAILAAVATYAYWQRVHEFAAQEPVTADR